MHVSLVKVTKLLATHATKKLIRRQNLSYVNGDSVDLYLENEILQNLAEDLFESDFASYSRMLIDIIISITFLFMGIIGAYHSLQFLINNYGDLTFDDLLHTPLIVFGLVVAFIQPTVTVRWLSKQIVRRPEIKNAYSNLKLQGEIRQGKIQQIRNEIREKKGITIISYTFINSEGKQETGKFATRADTDLYSGDKVYVLYLSDKIKILL
jgi:hypothetical protein